MVGGFRQHREYRAAAQRVTDHRVNRFVRAQHFDQAVAKARQIGEPARAKCHAPAHRCRSPRSRRRAAARRKSAKRAACEPQPCSSTTVGSGVLPGPHGERSLPQRTVVRLASARMGASAGSTLRRGGLRNISNASQPASDGLRVCTQDKEAAQPALHARRNTGHDASQHRLATFLHHWRKSMKVGHKLHRCRGGASRHCARVAAFQRRGDS